VPHCARHAHRGARNPPLRIRRLALTPGFPRTSQATRDASVPPVRAGRTPRLRDTDRRKAHQSEVQAATHCRGKDRVDGQ
jgi:hypothetical protein